MTCERPKPMKALTIWQPWASLIIMGVKPFEFRRWPAHRSLVGQRIAIHAGARKPSKAEIEDLLARLASDEFSTRAFSSGGIGTGLRAGALPLLESWKNDPSKLWLSAVLGTARLGKPTQNAQIVGDALGVKMADSDRYREMSWAWPLRKIEAFRPPIPAKGRQGFWNWEGGNG